MSYKELKKLIKDIVRASKKEEDSGVDSDTSKISGLEEEKVFFREVKGQLTLVDNYFNHIEESLKERFTIFNNKIPVTMEDLNEVEVNSLMSECRQLHMDMIMLENYAVINYCGFAKITKKHDKNTGFETRNKFMSKVVNSLNFSSYPNVVHILEKLENIFKRLEGATSKSRNRSYSNDDRLIQLSEVKEEKKMLQEEIPLYEEDAFDVLVRAATTSNNSKRLNRTRGDDEYNNNIPVKKYKRV